VVKERGEIRDEVQNLIVYQPSAGLGGTSLIEVAKDGSMKWGRRCECTTLDTHQTRYKLARLELFRQKNDKSLQFCLASISKQQDQMGGSRRRMRWRKQDRALAGG